LSSIIEHKKETCGLSSRRMNATIIFEYNIMCIAQMKR